MSDLDALRRSRAERRFDGFMGMVPEGRAEDAEACMRQTIDEIIALGLKPEKPDVRAAVERCVVRFNQMEEDGRWIMSTEREDIYYALDKIVDLTGVECADFDDWFWNADW